MGAQCKTPMTCGMQILEILFSKHPLPPPHAPKAKKIKQKNWEKTNGCVPQDWEIWVEFID